MQARAAADRGRCYGPRCGRPARRSRRSRRRRPGTTCPYERRDARRAARSTAQFIHAAVAQQHLARAARPGLRRRQPDARPTALSQTREAALGLAADEAARPLAEADARSLLHGDGRRVRPRDPGPLEGRRRRHAHRPLLQPRELRARRARRRRALSSPSAGCPLASCCNNDPDGSAGAARARRGARPPPRADRRPAAPSPASSRAAPTRPASGTRCARSATRSRALHVNHGLRGEESEADARHCAEALGAEVVARRAAARTEAALRDAALRASRPTGCARPATPPPTRSRPSSTGSSRAAGRPASAPAATTASSGRC